MAEVKHALQCMQITLCDVSQQAIEFRLRHEPPIEGGAHRAIAADVNHEFGALARHCTDQEDNAAQVEPQVRKSAAALLLASRISAWFDAIVTGASDKGTWVRISGPSAEGRVARGFQGARSR
jgi:exoribonuclease-2